MHVSSDCAYSCLYKGGGAWLNEQGGLLTLPSALRGWASVSF